MPRDARVVCEGVPYHVTQRGNYKQNIFEEDSDREVYMEFLMLYLKKFKLKLYAYCLMDNHVHFIVEPSDESGLANLFKLTHMRYSSYFNRKKGSPGHLFQGRFYSSPLDNEHLYEAVRYVELNPLRAKMVSRIDNYEWSSVQEHLTGKGKYKLHSVNKYMEIDDWKAYLNEKADDEIIENLRKKTKTNRPAGDAKFIKRLEKRLGKSLTFKLKRRPKNNNK